MLKSDKFWAWLAVVLYALVIFLCSATTGEYMPELFPGADKPLHFLEYMPFGFLIRRAFEKSSKHIGLLQSLLLSSFVVIFYALSDEVHQLIVPGRQFSFVDAFVDTAGGFLGSILYNISALRWLK